MADCLMMGRLQYTCQLAGSWRRWQLEYLAGAEVDEVEVERVVRVVGGKG